APGIVGIPVEGIAPFAPARRAVPAAGEVATARRRRPLAPRIGRLAAGAEHVLELRLAWQPVVASGLFGQPLGVGDRVLGADVDHRLVVVRGLAHVVAAPVHAAAADHVAAALVVHDRVAAPHRPRAVAGCTDEAAELADGPSGARRGEAPIETRPADGTLGIGRTGLPGRGAHAERAVPDDHHLRPAPAAGQRLGEGLAGAEQAVVRGQLDALAQ